MVRRAKGGKRTKNCLLSRDEASGGAGGRGGAKKSSILTTPLLPYYPYYSKRKNMKYVIIGIYRKWWVRWEGGESALASWPLTLARLWLGRVCSFLAQIWALGRLWLSAITAPAWRVDPPQRRNFPAFRRWSCITLGVLGLAGADIAVHWLRWWVAL